MKENASNDKAPNFSLSESALNSIRIRPELRAAQVKRSSRMVPAMTLYFDEKYDLGETQIPEFFRKVSLLECLRFIAVSDAQILEVPEPLWLRFAPKNFLLLATWKLSGFLKPGRRIAVTYAIENNNIHSLLSPRSKVNSVIERIFLRIMGAAICLTIDRIAFGSSAAMSVYHSLAGVKRIEHRLIQELPAESAATSDGIAAPSGTRAIFIGELDDRKGVLDLMKAWPSVEDAVPAAVLTVVGGGKHADAVEQWCLERPATRVFCGLVPHGETARQLSKADVLVAPSKRSGRWREQIGLPITEALSLGLTVVTTDETGLADWLSNEEHTVVPETDVESQLAAAIIGALKRPLPRTKVWQSLPVVPGRIAADAWLHTTHFSSTAKDTKNDIA
ncbi:glycosyltransferase family 4 protein [Arthrobacter oryzae]|uniref:glycosyltransferase family 4 protein n=1 Tax=Arthrobacter oryzae TaxID=409290 RepID=UPI00286597F0|nr:glycosyltransferase family 4 protein [Arthrobacter oryzae]MDR6505100.1 glycosyltransferase involved in cell wall biosynthesis [Arthrobacter oryzae]